MKKKVLALLCAVTVFGSLLAGCGGASGESDAPAAPAEQGGSDEISEYITKRRRNFNYQFRKFNYYNHT